MAQQSQPNTSGQPTYWRAQSAKSRWVKLGFVVLVLAIVYVTAITLHVRWDRIGTFSSAMATLRRFWPPDWAYLTELGHPALETVLMAIFSTAISALMSIPFIIFAARNVYLPFKPVFYAVGRFVITFTRSVHELVWALLFVTAVGLGAFAGVMALSVRSIGFISKMMAEAVETLDEGQIEAIKATGAGPLQVVLWGYVPQIIPTLIGVLIFRWDVNLRASTILGVVGAGGIGYMLDLSLTTFRYGRTTAIILVIIALVAVGELIATRLKKTFMVEGEGV